MGRETRCVKRVGVLRVLGAALLFGASAPAASVLASDMSALLLAGLLYLWLLGGGYLLSRWIL